MFKLCALALGAWLAAVPAARAEVQLSIRNGRVTIVARDATVRQILAEWARVGKTKVVNGERIPGGPLTLELKDVPEAEALDVLLRTLSGYLAAPRRALTSADASAYDSIIVMPTVAAAAPRISAPSSAPAPFSPPTFNQQQDDEDSNVPGRPAAAPQQPGTRPPIFSTFPSPQNGNVNTSARPTLPVVRPGQLAQPPANDQQLSQQFVPPVPQQAPPPAPQTSPGPRGAVSAPGMVAPAPSQPGQPQRPPN